MQTYQILPLNLLPCIGGMTDFSPHQEHDIMTLQGLDSQLSQNLLSCLGSHAQEKNHAFCQAYEVCQRANMQASVF